MILVRNVIGQCEAAMDFGLKIIAWYDRSLRLWTALFHDSNDDQVGVAGYGMSKKEAVADLQYKRSLAK